METDDRLSRDLYSCALCENLSDLSASCCCQENNENMTEVTEPRLLKRCNLQEGDILCSVHYEKLKSGMIFGGGGKSGCCAPFHVEQNHSPRLRPVPRVWRQLFDSADANNRYLPSLQICSQCYSITLDLVLNAESKNDQPEEEGSSDVSSNANYTSPSRWINSIALQGSDSTSGSTWSLNSSTVPRPSEDTSNHLISLYATGSETIFPTAIPESVKRYFRYSKRIGSVFSRKRRTIPRGDSVESPDENSIGNEAAQNDDHQFMEPTEGNLSSQSQLSPSGTDDSEQEVEVIDETQSEEIHNEPAVKLTLTPKRKPKQSLQPRIRNANKVTFAPIETSKPQEDDVLFDFSPQISRVENAALIGTSENPIPSESKECQRCNLKMQEKLKDDEDVAIDSNMSPSALYADTTENDLEFQPCKRKPMKITIKSIATLPADRQVESVVDDAVVQPSAEITSQNESQNCCNIQFISIAPKNDYMEKEDISQTSDGTCDSTIANNECSRSNGQTQNNNDSLILRMSESRQSLVQNVVEFLLNNLNGTNASQSATKRLVSLIETLYSNALQVYAGTLAQSIIDFALQDVTKHFNNQEKQKLLNDSFESNSVLSNAEETSQFLIVCPQCGASICPKVPLIESFAHGSTNNIVFDALQQMPEKREKAIPSFERHEHQEKYGVKRKEEDSYRTEFFVRVNDKMSDNNERTLDSSKLAENLKESKNEKNNHLKNGSSSFQVVKCIVEDLVPVTRSFSTSFIDRCGEDENHSFQPIVRSSSTESFFVMNCQLSDEQSSSEDELLVVPIGTSVQSHKEPESGVFMSTTETDRSYTESLASPLTDYSDTDRESMSSHFTHLSSTGNSRITEFEDISRVSDLKKDTQDKKDTSDENLPPVIKDECITLENLHSRELPQLITEECIKESFTDGVQELVSSSDLQAVAVNASETTPLDVAQLQMQSSLHSSESDVSNLEGSTEELLHSVHIGPEDNTDVPHTPDEVTSETQDTSNENLTAETFQNSNNTSLPIAEDALPEGDHDIDVEFKDSVSDQQLAPIAEDQANEQFATAKSSAVRRSAFREKTDRSVDWFPSDDVLRQRRSTQYLKALSQAAFLNARNSTTKRDKFRKSDEEPEDEDVSDVICAAMDESTPPFFRRKLKPKKEDNAVIDERSTLLLRIFIIMGVLGLVLFACWRYYFSLLV